MQKSKKSKVIRSCLILLLASLLLMAAVVATISISPRLGAQGADFIRNLIGPQPVAVLEEIVFTIQDTVNQVEFKLGAKAPAAPWQVAAVTVTPQFASETPTWIITSTQTLQPTQAATGTLIPTSPALPTSTQTPTATAAFSPTPTAWALSPIPALGNLEGEGVWTAYIQDANGVPLAYRTFLQPDPERPYVVVGVVAFDLTRTRLHYVLGTTEPNAPGVPPGPGVVPYAQQVPGVLLAAFNGGFKTVNGNFGVMANGSVIVAPIFKMGTLAMYRDGSLRMGEWGLDLKYSTDMVAYRQNCPLMVHNGAINPQVNNNSVNDWGGTVKGDVVTFRSGIGLSQDGKVLYYFAGQDLNMPALAAAMLDAGAYQGMQLDINNYYVLFTTFKFEKGQMQGVPLLPKDMNANLNRFLAPYVRDFFYVTAITPAP